MAISRCLLSCQPLFSKFHSTFLWIKPEEIKRTVLNGFKNRNLKGEKLLSSFDAWSIEIFQSKFQKDKRRRKQEVRSPFLTSRGKIPCRLAAKRQGRASTPLFDLSSLISVNQLVPRTCAPCWSSELVQPEVQLQLEQCPPFNAWPLLVQTSCHTPLILGEKEKKNKNSEEHLCVGLW